MINLNELPDQVDAYDEKLFEAIALRVAHDMGVSERIVTDSAMMDEYHDCPLSETYPEYVTFDDDAAGGPAMIPTQAMIDYARAEVEYYRDDEDTARDIAFADEIRAMSNDDKIARIRAYLDQFMPDEFQPYEVVPTFLFDRQTVNIFMFAVVHDYRVIGYAQFNSSVDSISVPLMPTTAGTELFNAQQDHFGGSK